MNNGTFFTNDPASLLNHLKSGASTRKIRSLDILTGILEKQAESKTPDFTIATIGRISQKNGGPSAQSIRNKGGEDYRTLIGAWASSADTSIKNRSLTKPKVPTKATELLSKIEDPALRAVMGSIIAERNRYMSENKVLKSQSTLVVDLRQKYASAPPERQDSPTLLGILTDTEIEALEYAISEDMLLDNNWKASPNGRIKNSDGKTVLKIGFLSAIKKLLNSKEND